MKRLHEKLEKCYDMTARLETIRLIEPQVDESKVLRSLLPFLRRQHQQKPMIFHIDITSSVSTSQPLPFMEGTVVFTDFLSPKLCQEVLFF